MSYNHAIGAVLTNAFPRAVRRTEARAKSIDQTLKRKECVMGNWTLIQACLWSMLILGCTSTHADEGKTLYNLSDAREKLVDDHGNGYEPLYGTRNLRAVLRGVYYRGGANNYYNRTDRRNNSNPLPDEGLKHSPSPFTFTPPTTTRLPMK
jgi:hypothetical protein